MHREENTELAIPDLQRRLMLLGYKLDNEADEGLFGERTAAAIARFKETNGLGFDDTLDQTTWTALKDASRQMGDRLLYLHMPHFRGKDVGALQSALSSMGFACFADSNFGPETEQALRDFQDNMGLKATGILDDDTLLEVLRLKHLWDGKRGIYLDGRAYRDIRSSEILKSTPICFFGTDEPTRAIANGIANLARATTVESKIVCASSLSSEPRKDMLLVGIKYHDADESKKKQAGQKDPVVPEIHLGASDKVIAETRKALEENHPLQKRLVFLLSREAFDQGNSTVQRQEAAARILDVLCTALAELKPVEITDEL